MFVILQTEQSLLSPPIFVDSVEKAVFDAGIFFFEGFDKRLDVFTLGVAVCGAGIFLDGKVIQVLEAYNITFVNV